MAVPKKITLDNKDTHSKDFAYISGLIASDGHIKIDSRHATTSFYNTDRLLIDIFKEKMNRLEYSYSIYTQKKVEDLQLGIEKSFRKKICIGFITLQKSLLKTLYHLELKKEINQPNLRLIIKY